jgi:hypothetical protein
MSEQEERKPVELVLLDGKTYRIRAMTLGPLIDIYPKIQAVFELVPKGDLAATLSATADVVLAALNDSGYQVTREQLLNDLVDVVLVQEAFAAVIAVSGLKIKPADPGKVLALTRIPTGQESSATSPAPLVGPSSTSEAA